MTFVFDSIFVIDNLFMCDNMFVFNNMGRSVSSAEARRLLCTISIALALLNKNMLLNTDMMSNTDMMLNTDALCIYRYTNTCIELQRIK